MGDLHCWVCDATAYNSLLWTVSGVAVQAQAIVIVCFMCVPDACVQGAYSSGACQRMCRRSWRSARRLPVQPKPPPRLRWWGVGQGQCRPGEARQSRPRAQRQVCASHCCALGRWGRSTLCVQRTC